MNVASIAGMEAGNPDSVNLRGRMTWYQFGAIAAFFLALAGAGVALYAAIKRRPFLMLIALGVMQVPLGIDNLRDGPHSIGYFELAAGALIIITALARRSKLQPKP